MMANASAWRKGLADNCQRFSVREDNCQRGQLSEDQLSVGHGQLSEETVRAMKKL